MIMMSSFFAPAPFRRFDLGAHAREIPRLGQNIFSSLLQDVGLSDASFSTLIKDLPQDAKDFNSAQWDACKKLGLTTAKGAKCAAELFAAIKAGQTTPATGATPIQTQAPSTFPVVPVLIGLAAAGGLVYYLVSRGK